MPAQPPFLPGTSYNTQLPFLEEMKFRNWLKQNKVPFDPEVSVSDYDMRGYWGALQQNNPLAASSINPNDQMLHYPDYWKTPLHQTFSAESQWAGPDAPQWIDESRLAAPSGRIVFDEKQPPDRLMEAITKYGITGQ